MATINDMKAPNINSKKTLIQLVTTHPFKITTVEAVVFKIPEFKDVEFALHYTYGVNKDLTKSYTITEVRSGRAILDGFKTTKAIWEAFKNFVNNNKEISSQFFLKLETPDQLLKMIKSKHRKSQKLIKQFTEVVGVVPTFNANGFLKWYDLESKLELVGKADSFEDLYRQLDDMFQDVEMGKLLQEIETLKRELSKYI